MDFSSICRTCTSGNSLNPIFVTNHDTNTYSNAIYIATGVKVQYNDNLPQNMCTDCINKLTDILNFRMQCKNIETKLLKIIDDTDDTKNIQNIGKKKQNDSNESRSNTTIKNEFKNDIKDESDFDDNKPLKLFLDSQSSNLENIKKQEFNENIFNNFESFDCKTDISDTDSINENHKQISINNIEDENTLKSHISDNIQENINVKQLFIVQKSINEIMIKNKINKSSRNTTELPYQIINDIETEKVSRVICKLCNKELSIRSIDSHMTRRHPGADERKIKCDFCDSYIMKDKLNRHMVMMHGSGSLKCGYCKSEFVDKEVLVEHASCCTAKKRKRKVNDTSRELRECDVCHKVMQKASIRMHKAVKHAGLKPVCEHCGKTFGNKFRLNEHCRAKHGYEKFQCSTCEFKSASVMAMRNHERRHRGEKPFVCETCGAKFHAAYLLVQHRHSHKTEKLVKCNQCPATFKANNSLHMHKLTCHSTNMYKCVVCSKSYKCRHYAVKHVRHVHRYNGPTPPLTVITNENVVKVTTQ